MINPHPFPLPPNAIQSDGGRNPIGWRTQSDRTADGGRSTMTFTVLLAPESPTRY